jgi:hypothetical protein
MTTEMICKILPFSNPNEDTEETAVPALKPKEYSLSSHLALVDLLAGADISD